MKLGFGVSRLSEEKLRYARQLGADGIFLAAQAIGECDTRGFTTAGELAVTKREVESHGLEILTIRIDPMLTMRAVPAIGLAPGGYPVPGGDHAGHLPGRGPDPPGP